MSKQQSRFFGPQATDRSAGVLSTRLDYITPILNRIKLLPSRSGPAAFAEPNALHTRRPSLEQPAFSEVKLADKSDVAVCTTTIRVQQLRDLVNLLEQDSSSLKILRSTLQISGAFTNDDDGSSSSANQTTEVRHYHSGFCTVSMRTNHDTVDLVDGLQMRNRCPRCRCIEQGLERREPSLSKYSLYQNPPRRRTSRRGLLKACRITSTEVVGLEDEHGREEMVHREDTTESTTSSDCGVMSRSVAQEHFGMVGTRGSMGVSV
ncbi:hypothetical protein LTR56_001476 [Elasticomyces elasticus]|nr:hypothetical protein LTR56_001476 [Elasticomyces elasticus]KAK3668601.1 hypothetical protein LTR22_000488 [Elasticomyces elasticus]KAK4931953.1 hypothetical protein LTR49_001640 [Elasticomyces elasticus]KAK5768515.1 hypothetical protein LTS12_001303 [Elasticomyces elasticus]